MDRAQLITPNSPVAFVDIETTGCQPGMHRVIDVAVIGVTGDHLDFEWQTLVHPGTRISAGITAMTCSRVTPAFAVRMTITPVIVGAKACGAGWGFDWVWATDRSVMEVAPIRVRVSMTTSLRIAFIGLVSRSTAVTSVSPR